MAELLELQLLPKRELFRVANLLSLIQFFPYHQGSDILERYYQWSWWSVVKLAELRPRNGTNSFRAVWREKERKRAESVGESVWSGHILHFRETRV